MQPERDDITRLLLAARGGDDDARSKLIDLIYPELRQLAHRHMARERSGHTLQATALINEAWIRLNRQNNDWKNRTHFFAAAAQTMRHILVDYARQHKAARRGGGADPLHLDELPLAADLKAEKLLALDEALSRLSEWQPRQCQVVELRFFAGMSEEESAEALGVSPRTVKRDWRAARDWLYSQIGK